MIVAPMDARSGSPSLVVGAGVWLYFRTVQPRQAALPTRRRQWSAALLQLAMSAESLMAEIRALGRVPKRKKREGDTDQEENKLAKKLGSLKSKKRLSEAQLEELAQLTEEHVAETERLMAAIKTLGRVPKRNDRAGDTDQEENKLAKKLGWLKKQKET